MTRHIWTNEQIRYLKRIANGKPKKVNNRLADIEFNIITDTLRTKNCQKNVDFRLKNLKQNLEG